MIQVRFYDTAEIHDEAFLFAVVVARYKGAWVFCKHIDRTTWECPGGHREKSESLLACAKRELYEETGAIEAHFQQLCAYSVQGKTLAKESSETKETYGMLYYAEIEAFVSLPDYEMEYIAFFSQLPSLEQWTYPEIQPLLVQKAIAFIS